MSTSAPSLSAGGTVGGNGVLKPHAASLTAVQLEDLADRRSMRSMREIIAVWLVGLLCAVLALAFIALLVDAQGEAADKRFTHLKGLLDVVLGPLVTLVSSAVGFYFGTQAASARTGGADGSAPKET